MRDEVTLQPGDKATLTLRDLTTPGLPLDDAVVSLTVRCECGLEKLLFVSIAGGNLSGECACGRRCDLDVGPMRRER